GGEGGGDDAADGDADDGAGDPEEGGDDGGGHRAGGRSEDLSDADLHGPLGADEGGAEAALALGDRLGPAFPGVTAAVGAEPDLLAEAVEPGLLGDLAGERDAADRVEGGGAGEGAEADAGHREGPFEAADGGVLGAEDATPLGEGVDDGRGGVDDAAGGHVAEAGGDVDGVPDVVVALQQDDLAGGGAAAEGHRHPGLLDGPQHLEGGGQHRGGLDGDQHGAVAEPFGDAHVPAGADVADHRPEGTEDADGPLVALDLGQGGEPGQVDEAEVPKGPHPKMLARPRPGRGPGWPAAP